MIPDEARRPNNGGWFRRWWDRILYGSSTTWEHRIIGGELVMTRLVGDRREVRPCTTEEEHDYATAEAW